LAPLLGWDRDGIEVDLPRLGRTRVGLRGRHQAANVAVADAVLDALAEAGIATTDDDARRRGYATATWPGRLELIRAADRDILLDGAHNPAGAAALALALDDLRPVLDGGSDAVPPPLTLVVASMADKDVDGVIGGLLGASALRGARIVATSIEVPRALSAEALAGRWRALGGPPGSATSGRSRTPARPSTGRSRRRRSVVVAGSLYFVGVARGGSSTTRGCATRRTTANERRPVHAIPPATGPARLAGVLDASGLGGAGARPRSGCRTAPRAACRPVSAPRRSGGGPSPGAPGRS
jgi:hypothetical protein